MTARFSNPATGGSRSPTTLVNSFRNLATLVSDFRKEIIKWVQEPFNCRFRNPAISKFGNPATLANGFLMPVGFRNPATSKGNLFWITVKCWNTLTFVVVPF